MYFVLVTLCFILIIVVSVIFLTSNKTYDKFLSRKIPLNVYMTWHNKEQLLPCLRENLQTLKEQNPEFTFHLYDEEDCRNFIRKNFDSIVLKCYDTLIPKAYKADLWRYCILYKKGGIYIDLKLKPVSGFKLKELIHKEHFVLDRPYMLKYQKIESELDFIQDYRNFLNIDDKLWRRNIGIYNAFLVVYPNNLLMKHCIDRICKNVMNKDYGYGDLYPTGPGMLGELYFSDDYLEKLKSMEFFFTREGTHIISKKGPILRHLQNYRNEQRQDGEPHFTEFWNSKNIYKV